MVIKYKHWFNPAHPMCTDKKCKVTITVHIDFECDFFKLISGFGNNQHTGYPKLKSD